MISRSLPIGLGILGGPNGETTPIVLDALLFLEQQATFFLEQHLTSRNPHITYRIREEGHEVAVLGTRQEDGNDQRSMLSRAVRDLFDITGERSFLFLDRSNADVSAATGSARMSGLEVVHWTHRLPHDSDQSPEAAAKHLLEVIRPGDTLIIDGLSPNPPVLVDFERAHYIEHVITRLRTQGYALSPISEIRA